MKTGLAVWNVCVGLLVLAAAAVADEGNAVTPAVAVQRLIADIVPSSGLIRPPYQPARYDLGLRSDSIWTDDKLTLKDLRKLAAERQDRLESLWPTAAKARPTTPAEQADLDFVKYAFTGKDVSRAYASARKSGFVARLRLARLQLAECNYGSAVKELIALANSKEERRDEALALLVHHAEARRTLAGRVQLLPLPVDLDAYLAKRAQSEKTRWMIEAIRRRYKKSEVVTAPEQQEPEVLEEIDPEIVVEDWDDDGWEVTTPEAEEDDRLVLKSIKTPHLQTKSDELEIRAAACGPVHGDSLTLHLRSLFHGRLQFRLYRFADEQKWRGLQAAELAATKPIRAWSREFQPVRQNNRKPETDTRIEIKDLKREGFYLVTCEAPYAPMIAAQKFIVSRAALYLRVGRNQAVVTAVDRRTGKGVPGLNITLSLSGAADASRLNREQTEAFRAGFTGNAKDEAPAEMDLAEAVKWAREYAAGRAARRRFPAVNRTWDLRTQANGTVAVDLDIGRPTYRYTLQAAAPSRSFSRAQVEYQHEETPEDRPRPLLWTAQPIYRPGSVVRFKGIVRNFNGRRLAPADPNLKTADVQVHSQEGVIWRQSCPLSKAGCVKGKFRLPITAPLGAYRIHVNGAPSLASAEFTVKEFRLPTFKVRVDTADTHVAGGQTTDATVKVEYANGRPAAEARIELQLEIGSQLYPVPSRNTDRSGRATIKLPPMPTLDEGTTARLTAVVMDAAGQSYKATDRFYVEADAFQVKCTAKSPYAKVNSKLVVHVKHWQTGEPIAGAKVFRVGHRTAYTTNKQGKAIVMFNGSSNAAGQALALQHPYNQRFNRSPTSFFLVATFAVRWGRTAGIVIRALSNRLRFRSFGSGI